MTKNYYACHGKSIEERQGENFMFLRKSKLFSIAVCIITVLSMFSLMIPGKVNADSNDKSLTLVCISSDTVLSGMKWKLYKVGKRISGKGNFSQIGDFAGFQINFSRLTPERVNEAAQTFQSYAIANKIAPLREGQTNEYGEVEFTGLDSGLYLVTGKLLKVDTHYYVPTTALIEIKEDDTNLRYNAYPKFEYQVANAQPRNYTVDKVWVNDENHLSARPIDITVDLYKDEEYYDTVILNEDNKWKYRWTDLDGTSTWIAMERDVPENYELKIEFSYDSAHYHLINSYVEDEGTGTTITTSTSTTATSVGNEEGSRTRTTTSTTVSNAEDTRTNTATTVSGTLVDGSDTKTTTTATVYNDTVTRTGTDVTTTGTVNNGTVTRTRTTASTRDNEGKVTTTRRPSGGNSSGGGGGGGNNGGGSGSGGGKLPQTGQLWWPVVPLSIGGVLLVGAGLVIRSRKKED